MPISPLSVGVLLFDGFSQMVLASAVEPLRAARDIAGPGTFAWTLASPGGGSARSSSGIEVAAAAPDALAGADIALVVAGYGARRHAGAETAAALHRLARRAKRLGGLDSGAWLLAGAGLLDGHRATVHWQDLDAFAEAFPAVDAVPDRIVVDRTRLTAGDASAALDLMLGLVAEHAGSTVAYEASKLFAHTPRPAERVPAPRAPKLLRAIAEMRRTLDEPLSLPRLARAAAVSPRTLARLFERELGVSPGRYYGALRLAAARALAEETELAAREIAARTGFGSVAGLSRALKCRYGAGIRTLRATRR